MIRERRRIRKPASAGDYRGGMSRCFPCPLNSADNESEKEREMGRCCWTSSSSRQPWRVRKRGPEQVLLDEFINSADKERRRLKEIDFETR